MFHTSCEAAKFSLVTSIHRTANKDQFCIYIKKESLKLLTLIIKPYMCPSAQASTTNQVYKNYNTLNKIISQSYFSNK